MEQLYSFFLIAAMFLIMYIFMIRPESKRKKEADAMRKSLAVGDEVSTIGGIMGTVCAVKENTLVIETGADRVRLEVTRWSIADKGTMAKK